MGTTWAQYINTSAIYAPTASLPATSHWPLWPTCSHFDIPSSYWSNLFSKFWNQPHLLSHNFWGGIWTLIVFVILSPCHHPQADCPLDAIMHVWMPQEFAVQQCKCHLLTLIVFCLLLIASLTSNHTCNPCRLIVFPNFLPKGVTHSIIGYPAPLDAMDGDNLCPLSCLLFSLFGCLHSMVVL